MARVSRRSAPTGRVPIRRPGGDRSLARRIPDGRGPRGTVTAAPDSAWRIRPQPIRHPRGSFLRRGAGPIGARSATGAGPPTDTSRTAPTRQRPRPRGEDTACMSDVSVFQGGSQRGRTEDTGVTGQPIRPSASSSLSVSSSPPTSSGRPAYPSSVWFSPAASPPRRYSSTRPAGSWISVCWGNRRSTRRAKDPNRSNDCASMLKSGLPFGSV